MSPAPFVILIHERATKALAKIDKGARVRIGRAISDLADEPEPSGSKPLKGYPHLRRIRVGDFRIVYQVDQGAIQVLVVLVGHRRDVYDILKRLPTSLEQLKEIAARLAAGGKSPSGPTS